MFGVKCEVVGPTILSPLQLVLDVVTAREMATMISRLRVTTPGVHVQFSEAWYALLPSNLRDRIALWSSAMTPSYSTFGFECRDYAVTLKGDVAKHRALVRELPVGAPTLPDSLPFAFGVAWGQYFIDGEMRDHAANLYLVSTASGSGAGKGSGAAGGNAGDADKGSGRGDLAPLFFEPLSLKVPVDRYYRPRTQVSNISLLVL